MAEQNKQEVAGYISSSYTCNNSPKYGCHTEAGRVEAKRLGGCELHPEPVSPEWIARAAEECAHEILDESYKMGTTVKAKKMCHDIDIAWIGTERIKAIIQAAIERNSK